MANVLTAKIGIRGTRPLIWHWFNPESMGLEKKEKRGKPGYDPDEWLDSVLTDENGRLFIKHTYLFGAIRNGAKFCPAAKGRGSMMTAVASTIQTSAVDGSENIFLLNDLHLPEKITTDQNEPVYLDVRGVVVNRAKHVRSRVAASPGWELEFLLTWDVTIVDRDTMYEAVSNAGRLVGIGDGRQIGYGRFEIVYPDISMKFDHIDGE